MSTLNKNKKLGSYETFESKLQSLNYSTHAISFFNDMAVGMEDQAIGPSDLEKLISSLLVSAVKYLLPMNGYLLAEHDYKPWMYDLLLLPHPVIALEFTADSELFTPGKGLTQSKKRIAIAFDPRRVSSIQHELIGKVRLNPNWIESLPARSLCVISVYCVDDTWGCSVGMLAIDLDNDKPRLVAAEPDAQLNSKSIESRLGRTQTKYGLPVVLMPFLQRLQLLGLDTEEGLDNLYIDAVDEVRVTYEFLAALNCANVGTLSIPAPKLLNAKRLQKKKVPFFAYQVLDLSPHTESSGGTGNSQSPRSHLRRGHLRRLGEKFGSKVLWINATAVNGVPSKISDTYRVRI